MKMAMSRNDTTQLLLLHRQNLMKSHHPQSRNNRVNQHRHQMRQALINRPTTTPQHRSHRTIMPPHKAMATLLPSQLENLLQPRRHLHLKTQPRKHRPSQAQLSTIIKQTIIKFNFADETISTFKNNLT